MSNNEGIGNFAVYLFLKRNIEEHMSGKSGLGQHFPEV